MTFLFVNYIFGEGLIGHVMSGVIDVFSVKVSIVTYHVIVFIVVLSGWWLLLFLLAVTPALLTISLLLIIGLIIEKNVSLILQQLLSLV